MNNNKPPRVSVIVLNYNGKLLIEECIKAVLAQTYNDYELIVVDNGSTDDSPDYIRKTFPDRLNIIELKTNHGFAEGNNVGIEEAKGHYVALLNNDAVADQRWLERIMAAAETSEKSFGMWASKILFYDDKTVIDTAGHLIYPDGLNRGRGKGETDSGQYDKMEEVFFPSGCAALYLRDVLALIGGFDKDFFAYGDDTDIGLKAQLSGWKCLYVPDAVVYHKSSSTAGMYSPFKAYLVERNRIWILIKYFPLSRIIFSLYYTALRYLFQAYGALAGKGSAGRFVEGASRKLLFGVLVKAYCDAFRKIPLMIQKRIAFKKNIRVSSQEFSLWLQKYRISAEEISLRD